MSSFFRELRHNKRLMSARFTEIMGVERLFDRMDASKDVTTAQVWLQTLRRLSLGRIMDKAVHIRAQNVCDYYRTDDKDCWYIEKDFPTLAAPWPLCFFEWTRPQQIWTKQDQEDHEHNMTMQGRPPTISGQRIGSLIPALRQAALLASIELVVDESEKTDIGNWHTITPTLSESNRQVGKPRAIRWMHQWVVFLENARGYSATSFRMYVGPNGEFVPDVLHETLLQAAFHVTPFYVSELDNNSIGAFRNPANLGALQRLSDAAVIAMHIPLLAISFANCKNVPIVQQEAISEKKIKQYRKELSRDPGAVPPVRWHLLDIAPAKRIIGENQDPTNRGMIHALHIARGHFKNYEEGKGLMGKHHGLYWWNQQTRGNRNKGKVIKDYSVKPKTKV